jgi:hypothetical protein
MKIKDVPMVRIFDNAYYQSFYKSLNTKTTFEFPVGTNIKSFT